MENIFACVVMAIIGATINLASNETFVGRFIKIIMVAIAFFIGVMQGK